MNNVSSVRIDLGETTNLKYLCERGKDQSVIEIVKEESPELTYKVSVFYKGFSRNNSPRWTCNINNKSLMIESRLCPDFLDYDGSTKFVFKPFNSVTLEIQESKGNLSESVWIDPAEEGLCYLVSKTPPMHSERIEALIEKGNFFRSSEGEDADMILYDKYVGVFVRAGESIYHAKESEEFIKCSDMSFKSDVSYDRFHYSIKIPTEAEYTHMVISQNGTQTAAVLGDRRMHVIVFEEN